MKSFIFLSILFIPIALSALTLKDKLIEAKVGTYIVTKQNKTYTLLRIYSLNAYALSLEEINIPSCFINASKHNWKQWIEDKAPGHSSWIVYSLDLSTNTITTCYSYDRKIFIAPDNLNAFLPTLLNLDLHLVSEKEQLQTAPSSKPGQVMANHIWRPPQYIEGKKIESPLYSVYKASWPKDRSELSGQTLIFYFDQKCPSFPFPYWIQAKQIGIKYTVKAVDSGFASKSNALTPLF